MRKLNKSELKIINGARRNCTGCPTGDYGPNAGPSRTCEDYDQIPSHCRICVYLSAYCS